MSASVSIDGLVEPTRVHRRLYTDPAIFEREMVDVFGGSWTYLCHESQIAEPDSYLTVDVGRRSTIVTRSRDGVVRALFNRCSHRGTTVVEGAGGCAKRFTCPYHGWSFANDGRLLAVPYPDSYGPSFDKAQFGLGGLRVEIYRGFVFGTVDHDGPDLAEYLGAASGWLDVHIDRNPGGELAVLPGPIRQEYRGNWKLAFDNASDGLHATFAHRSYNHLGRSTDVETVLARDPAQTEMFAKALGHGHMLVDQRPGLASDAWATMRAMPFSDELIASLTSTLGPDEARAQLELATGSMVNLTLFPNMILVGNQLMVVEPLAVDHTRLTLYLLAAPRASDEVARLRPRVEEDFTNFGTPDDLEMFERVQRGLLVPEMEWIDTSRGHDAGCEWIDPDDGLLTGPITSEAPMRGYHAEYLRLMTDRSPRVTVRTAGANDG
ncbi:aromatic ring-hydroxylating oxygenase subunit alpha [Ilumatobacter coccineus]|uniref:Putative aromatic-ring-hydroxylating dioxygenase alpha subunit n=1 Tax=Ilumatobacter coccineus (strain NBRC 103263 / KCTC 29153 / YM16-304) TaxID=1313172 RepID=A0A6C7DWF8_ILUCY|nr:aromatic ring-hydroxylating dioxygenase subunit alpha [Ilumatobacter coccineus]BAN00914.1 putative aromatic-ring-hydroxylating dioxygenase alpha subunit [Ilumatobacter coccineus YM16-304]